MRQTKLALLALAIVASIHSPCRADTQPNPYLSVVDRNPFGLKTPPPPPPETPPQPVVPLAKVVLTGITSVFGPPRAFVEITEQEPGKTPIIKKPILNIGEREGSIEVISIDVVNNSIRIKNGAIETNLVFEVAKTSTGPVPGAPSPLPMGTLQAAQAPAASAGAPTIISSGGTSPTGRAGTAVSVLGGSSPAVPSATSNPGTPNAAYPGAYASLGSTYASTYSPAGSGVNNFGAGISTYGAGLDASRPLRADPAYQPPMSSEESHLRLRAAADAIAARSGAVPPPVPPMPGEQGQAGGPPPLPPVPGRVH